VVNGYFEVFYSDEHALALGVRQVNVITTGGTTPSNYPVNALTANPGCVLSQLNVGSTCTTGDQAGVDVSNRPMYPALFVTDITSNHQSQICDWQWGGTAHAPNAVFGTWKAFTRTVNYTAGATPTVSVAADADPATNGWNLGAGADSVPSGLQSEGYGAEIRWNLSALNLIPGHSYRFYVMVHDGDQNKAGGDAGQAAYNYVYNPPAPPAAVQPASVSGTVTNTSFHIGFAGVTITLTGTDFNNNAVTQTTTTASDGTYSFANLVAGTYSLTATIPSTYVDSGDMIGTVNGVHRGTRTIPAEIDAINLNGGDIGINYNFGFQQILA
jgi:hypothetical protein